jgi:hypothetical protein
VQVCATGHDHCTFGGMSPSGGYWLIAEDCDRDHGELCAFCGQSGEVGFCDWVDGVAFGAIYRVVACDGCGQRWAALDPRWMRDAAGG